MPFFGYNQTPASPTPSMVSTSAPRVLSPFYPTSPTSPETRGRTMSRKQSKRPEAPKKLPTSMPLKPTIPLIGLLNTIGFGSNIDLPIDAYSMHDLASLYVESRRLDQPHETLHEALMLAAESRHSSSFWEQVLRILGCEVDPVDGVLKRFVTSPLSCVQREEREIKVRAKEIDEALDVLASSTNLRRLLQEHRNKQKGASFVANPTLSKRRALEMLEMTKQVKVRKIASKIYEKDYENWRHGEKQDTSSLDMNQRRHKRAEAKKTMHPSPNALPDSRQKHPESDSSLTLGRSINLTFRPAPQRGHLPPTSLPNTNPSINTSRSTSMSALSSVGSKTPDFPKDFEHEMKATWKRSLADIEQFDLLHKSDFEDSFWKSRASALEFSQHLDSAIEGIETL